MPIQSTGLGAAEWKCLGVLDLEGPAPAGRLAAASGFTTGAITGIVDRLERAGYVRREAHPTDRRSVVIRPLHVAGLKAKVGPIFASLRAAMAARGRPLPAGGADRDRGLPGANHPGPARRGREGPRCPKIGRRRTRPNPGRRT